ncbi:hypothetical protein HYDPIDRAFT_44638 [Hydnomerulius pinastri MD-312]|uniref:DUF6532 domain-containing protein n=1 Tax=Hydnomerulius pinastri MD-312 TaxID=994086 RepID=A0A0C9W716_9AGAM|nr:hypothetical protein HYDPIDRAFT_44638 [Hydnomerulius pinastri MD-312]
MLGSQNSDLTPSQIAANKRLAKKAASSRSEGDLIDSPDVDDGQTSRPYRKAKAKANEEKVWARSSRKRAPTSTELDQPRPKEARNQNESSLDALRVEATTRASGRGRGARNQTAAKGSSRAPNPLPASGPTKTASQTHKVAGPGANVLKASIGTIEDSDDVASATDEKENSSGPTSDQDEEAESDDEILQSLSSDPKKLREALTKEIPVILESSASNIRPGGTSSCSEGQQNLKKKHAGKLEARRELERPQFAPEAEPSNDEGQGTSWKVKQETPMRTSEPSNHPLGSSHWPPHTDLFVESDGSVLLKSQHPHMITLLHSAINFFLKSIVFENAFPQYEERRKMAIKALADAAQHHNEHNILRHLRYDSTYAGALATVPEGRLATYRRNIKKTAQSFVIANYGLKKGCSELITQLLFNDNFIYPQNVKGDAIRTEPFCHPAIINTLHALIFNGPSSLGVQFHDEFVSILDDLDDPELPCNMVTLVGTAVYSVLVDWRGGNGPVDPEKVSFSPNVHLTIHRRLDGLLQRIFKGHRGPQKYHVVMSRLYREASGSTADPTTETTELSAFDYLDFDGMPEN